MNSELSAAILLASFSFNRSAAQPRAITLTCTHITLIMLTAALPWHWRCTLESEICVMHLYHCRAPLETSGNRISPAGPFWHQGWP